MSNPKPKTVTYLIPLLVLLLAACASAVKPPTELPAPASTPAPPSERSAGDTLRLFYRQSPTILNPHLTTSLKDIDAARITYEPLASFNRNGELIPFLAAEIPSLENGGVAKDGTWVTWKLKQGLQWSDGRPFTADDVRFTFEYITNPDVGAASASTYEVVKSVETPDDHTVKIIFKAPNPAWQLVFVGVQGMILPRHIFEPYNNANAAQSPANEMPVGTGPYRVVKFQPEGVLFLGSDLIETKRIVYEPNPYFREKDKPWFSRVELKGGSDNIEAIYSVLQSNEADFAWNLILKDAAEIERLEALGYGRVIANPGSRVERILLNRTDPNKATADGEQSSLQFPNPFFSDKRVRQAINYAVDRNAIANLSGLAFPTGNNLVSPAMYNSPNTHYEFNLEKSAALLDEAGWIDHDGDGIRDKNGLKMALSFQTTVGNQLREQIQDMLKDSLAQIGVEVKLSTVDPGVLFGQDVAIRDHYRQFQTDMQLYRLGNKSPDPGAYMKQWTCDQIPQKANNWTGENVERWCSPAYDALYEQSAREFDHEKRRQLFIQMNDMLIEDVVMIPLINRGTFSGISNNLEGVELNAWESELWNIKDWRRKTSP